MAKARRISEQLMREELPYGMFEYGNGAKDLFNRKYERVRHKGPDPEGEPISRAFFFTDRNPPWQDINTKARCEAILREWDMP